MLVFILGGKVDAHNVAENFRARLQEVCTCLIQGTAINYFSIIVVVAQARRIENFMRRGGNFEFTFSQIASDAIWDKISK